MVRVPSQRRNPQTGAAEAMCVPCGGVYLPLNNFYTSSLKRCRRVCKPCHNKMRAASKTRSVASVLLARVTTNEARRGRKHDARHTLEAGDVERILRLYGYDPLDPTTVRMTVTRLERDTPLTPENAIVLSRAELQKETRRPGTVLTPERVKKARQLLWAARGGGQR